MSALERVIRPIVEGQIRGFIKEHPTILNGVDWYKPRDDKAVTLTNSLAKRIVRDLTCPIVRARLVAALLEIGDGKPLIDDAGIPTGALPPGLVVATGPGGCADKGS